MRSASIIRAHDPTYVLARLLAEFDGNP